MNVRLWIINCLLSVTTLAMADNETMASQYFEEPMPASVECFDVIQDTLTSSKEEELNRKIANYEKRLEKIRRFHDSLIPDFARFQYAGSIGLLNVGLGWAYGKKDQWETDVMLGYVPKYDKESHFFTVTLRETYVPWTKQLYGKTFSFQPLACGVFVNSVLDSDYWTREPDRYPNADYYRFSSKLRLHIFLGQRYTWNIPQEKRFISQRVSFVWELSSCDLYIISKAVNKTLPWLETLSLSFGLKYDF